MVTAKENPFRFGEPVQEPDFFFGRKKEVRQTLNALQGNQCVSLVGPGKIGKTSTLHYVSTPQVFAELGFAADRYSFIYVDGRQLSDRDATACFQHIGVQIQEENGGSGSVNFLRDLTRTCRAFWRGSGKSLVIMLDNFEALIGNEQLDASFFANLRSLNTNPDFRLAYLTASEESLGTLEFKYLGINTGDDSPFFNVFTTISLGRLSPRESRLLLERCFMQAGLVLAKAKLENGHTRQPANRHTANENAPGVWGELKMMVGRFLRLDRDDPVDTMIDLIIEQAGGHPYLIQWLGRQAVDIWRSHNGRWNSASTRKFLACLQNMPDV